MSRRCERGADLPLERTCRGALVALSDQLDLRSVPSAAADGPRSARAGARAPPVLDVGCGCETTIIELGRTVGPNGHVVGLDVSVPLRRFDRVFSRFPRRQPRRSKPLPGNALPPAPAPTAPSPFAFARPARVSGLLDEPVTSQSPAKRSSGSRIGQAGRGLDTRLSSSFSTRSGRPTHRGGESEGPPDERPRCARLFPPMRETSACCSIRRVGPSRAEVPSCDSARMTGDDRRGGPPASVF
jgi:hypothetical protein